MAKTWVELTTCDFCVPLFKRDKPNPVEGDPERVQLPDGELMEGEICRQCKDHILDSWYQAWSMLGRPVGTPPEKPSEAPVAPEPEPLVPEPQVMAKPVKKAEAGKVIPKGEVCIDPDCEYRTEGGREAMPQHIRVKHGRRLPENYGTRCPLDGEEVGGALGMHTKTAHDGVTIGRAFTLAMFREGDPHGVVAERQKILARR